MVLGRTWGKNNNFFISENRKAIFDDKLETRCPLKISNHSNAFLELLMI
jgi:hypothetical protein